MDKLAVNLEQIRQASKAFISKMRGEGRALSGALEYSPITSTARLLRKKDDVAAFGKQVLPAGFIPGRKETLRTYSSILKHNPEQFPAELRNVDKLREMLVASGMPKKSLFYKIPEPYEFLRMANSQLPPKSRVDVGLIKRTPWNREAINRWVIMHEATEAGKHFIKSQNPNVYRMATHLSTRPLLADLNIAATSQGGDFPLNVLAQTIRKLRRGEVSELASRVPEIRRLSPGYQKINRSAQKHLQRLWEKRRAASVG
jgi:hypothetical protein